MCIHVHMLRVEIQNNTTIQFQSIVIACLNSQNNELVRSSKLDNISHAHTTMESHPFITHMETVTAVRLSSASHLQSMRNL